MSATETVQARPLRAIPAFAVGAAVFALLIVQGNGLLNDPDTFWQVTLGQWIVEHRTVPWSDIYSWTKQGEPWISTQWLAQAMYALSYEAAGWNGPVVLAALAIAAAFGLFARVLNRHLTPAAVLIFLLAAIALSAGHLLARPHALALPVMVAWTAGLVAAMDRGQGPSFRLLPLMALWSNLHGGFVLGLALIGPVALDIVLQAPARDRVNLALRWAAFGLLALAMACLTPYGYEALMGSRRILGLGAALDLIGEWRPANFAHPGPLEVSVLLGFALALWRGISLPPVRLLIVIGFVAMALGRVRNAEVLALLGPMVIAMPLGRQIGGPDAVRPVLRSGAMALIVAALAVATVAMIALRPYTPNLRASPVAAVNELKRLGLKRVFNDYDFGGYLISQGVPTFIDGRTELFGETFMVEHNSASGLIDPENLFRLLDRHQPEATFMRTESAATKLLDHMAGWRKVYSDDLATIHVRDAGAAAAAAPPVEPRPAAGGTPAGAPR